MMQILLTIIAIDIIVNISKGNEGIRDTLNLATSY